MEGGQKITPMTEFFLVRIFPHRTEYREIRISPYAVRMRENTDQKKLCIWKLFTQCLIHISVFSRYQQFLQVTQKFLPISERLFHCKPGAQKQGVILR